MFSHVRRPTPTNRLYEDKHYMNSHKAPLDHTNEWNNPVCASPKQPPVHRRRSLRQHRPITKRPTNVNKPSHNTHPLQTIPDVSSPSANLRPPTPTKRSSDRRKTATWNLQDLLLELKQPPRTALPPPAWTFHSIFTDPAWPTRELLPIILAPRWRKETYNDVLSVGTR